MGSVSLPTTGLISTPPHERSQFSKRFALKGTSLDELTAS